MRPPSTEALRVLVVQHLPHEHAGVLGEVMAVAGLDVRTVRAWTGEPVPTSPGGRDAVVVLGGDMDTDEEDRWPHLGDARRLLAAAVEADVPALGLCLGAQLLAEATGGQVHHGRAEIGFVPIHLTPSGRTHPVTAAGGDGTPFFNAHGDHVTAPPTAQLLAFSDGAAVHAFAVGCALGLQYHPEVDASAVATYVEAEGVAEHLRAAGWEPAELVRQARLHNAVHRAAAFRLFGAWVGSLAG